MAVSNGNCFICGKTTSKIAIKNHILKEHTVGDEPCYLFKAEGAYNKDYWLFFTVPVDATLSAVDKFLRAIWCECCGHLSAFRMGGQKFGKSRNISALGIGDALLYEYDFGSATEIILTVVGEISRVKQKDKIQLLARNVPPRATCDECGASAAYFDIDSRANYCNECAENADDEEMLVFITNSPRSGGCGYDGELDIWEFEPDSPFPQP